MQAKMLWVRFGSSIYIHAAMVQDFKLWTESEMFGLPSRRKVQHQRAVAERKHSQIRSWHSTHESAFRDDCIGKTYHSEARSMPSGTSGPARHAAPARANTRAAAEGSNCDARDVVDRARKIMQSADRRNENEPRKRAERDAGGMRMFLRESDGNREDSNRKCYLTADWHWRGRDRNARRQEGVLSTCQ